MAQRTVIILHGWNLSGKRFAPLAALLRRLGYRVFAPDLPGFGTNPAPNTAWHVRDYADYLYDFIKARHITDPVLVGHSFGGRVALMFAHRYPAASRSLVLTGTPGFSPVPKGKMTFFLLIAKAGGLMFSLPGIRNFADTARRFLYRAAGAHEFYRAEGTMRQTFKNTVNDDLSVAMRSVRIPCALIWGSDDTIVPVSVAQRMKETIPGATLLTVPGCGHGLPFTHPDTFADAAGPMLGS